MKHILQILAFFCLCTIVNSQSAEESIKQMDAYFEIDNRKQTKDYKFYQRWKGDIEYQITPNQEFKNYSALKHQAYKREIKKAKNTTSNRSTNGSWEDIGPFDYTVSDSYSGGGLGRVNCTAFHPTNSNIMWVGTAAGGIWKTTNGGADWTPISDMLSSISVTSIIVHPSDPNTIYLLTGDGDGSSQNPSNPGSGAFPGQSSIGVLKTTDGGAIWESKGLSFNQSDIKHGYCMVMHPTDPDILLVGMRNDGIFRTSNGGDSWSKVFSDGTIWDIEFKPGSPNTVYASSANQRFLISPDGGLTWPQNDDTDFPGAFNRMAIAISPSNPTSVYAIFGGGNVAGQFNGFYKSADSGNDFTLMSNSPNILGGDLEGDDAGDFGWWTLSLIVDPSNDARVFVGGVNCWKSENRGITWGRETWWRRDLAASDPYVHADFHNFYFNGSTLFANNDGGIYKTNDYGHSWTELSSGLSIMQFYEIDILGNEYIGGAQDNGTNGSNFSDPTCHNLWGGDGFAGVWHTGDNSIQYISTQNTIYRRQLGSSIIISPFSLNNFWHTEIEMHTGNPDFVFVSSQNELYRGNGSAFGFSWDSLGISAFFTGAHNTRIFGLSQCTSDPNTMYVVNQTRILRTTNLNASNPFWTPIANPAGSFAFISNVVVNPTNPAQVWVVCGGYATGNKVFYSNNYGGSWTNISGSLPNVPIRCIAYHPGSNNGLYVGTEIGVYYRSNATADWIFFSNFLPNTIVRDIEVSATHVFAGTFGRGVWKSQHHSTCIPNMVLTPANDPSNPLSIGEQHYNASNSITSTRLISGTEAEIFYTAGNYIDMLPGFASKENTFMEVKPGGCPD